MCSHSATIKALKAPTWFNYRWLCVGRWLMPETVKNTSCNLTHKKKNLLFCLSDAISAHSDHGAFRFCVRLCAARFQRLSEFLSEDWTSSSVMADGCWYTPRLILSQIFTYSKKNTYKPLFSEREGFFYVGRPIFFLLPSPKTNTQRLKKQSLVIQTCDLTLRKFLLGKIWILETLHKVQIQ